MTNNEKSEVWRAYLARRLYEKMRFPHKQTPPVRKWVYRIVHHLIEQAKPKIEVTFDEETVFKGRRKRL